MQRPHTFMPFIVSSCFLLRYTRGLAPKLPKFFATSTAIAPHVSLGIKNTSNEAFHTIVSSPFSWNLLNQRPAYHSPSSFSSSSSHASSPYTNDRDGITTTTSMDYALDPHSKQAQQISSSLGLTPTQHSQLVELAFLVVDWNERINLISRKDCTPEVVFGRHILPSIALGSLLLPTSSSSSSSSSSLSSTDTNENDPPTTHNNKNQRVVDVGTGGGFPGLPLAILYPNYDFLLVDSVGKKIKVVQAMAEELDLKNVKTHHGRAEEIPILKEEQKYDVVLGRSVSALPRFCFWIQDLVKQDNGDENEKGGKLVYIIGGEIEDLVSKRCLMDIPLNDLIPILPNKEENDQVSSSSSSSWSDKRALVFGSKEVKLIASESGEKKVVRTLSLNPSKKQQQRKKRRDAKGNWAKKDNSVPKQRGYENFKRYNS